MIKIDLAQFSHWNSQPKGFQFDFRLSKSESRQHSAVPALQSIQQNEWKTVINGKWIVSSHVCSNEASCAETINWYNVWSFICFAGSRLMASYQPLNILTVNMTTEKQSFYTLRHYCWRRWAANLFAFNSDIEHRALLFNTLLLLCGAIITTYPRVQLRASA